MPLDYRDAADRHWKDAIHLMSDSRLANADHLFGFSAECALKAVMQSLGMQMNPKKPGVPEPPFAVHIGRLGDEFLTFANARGGARYTVGIEGTLNPFSDWDISQRYNHSADISLQVVQNHLAGAKRTKAMLEEAFMDGGVT